MGLRFRLEVLGLRFRVCGLELIADGLWFQVLSLGFRICDLG